MTKKLLGLGLAVAMMFAFVVAPVLAVGYGTVENITVEDYQEAGANADALGTYTLNETPDPSVYENDGSAYTLEVNNSGEESVYEILDDTSAVYASGDSLTGLYEIGSTGTYVKVSTSDATGLAFGMIGDTVDDLSGGIFDALATALPFIVAITIFFFAWRMIMRRV